jgi:hypothetical protein
LAERWRQPVVPLEVRTTESQGLVLPDGRIHREAALDLRADDVDRMRAGYVCAKCLEPFEQAWPERCHVCGAPIRTEQAAYFAREYGGEERLGSRVSLVEELEQLPERQQEEERRE